MNMDLKSSLVVYTTRLNEMTLFKKDISKMKPKDILQTILSESKPQYKATNYINKTPLLKIKQERNEDEYDDIKKDHRLMLNNLNFLLTYDELESKLEVIKNKINSLDNEPIVYIKSESDVNCKGISKLDKLMSLCKPLKIILEDIFKKAPITNPEVKSEVFIISSDSDDEVLEMKRKKDVMDKVTINKELTNKTAMSSGKSSTAAPVNEVVKTINEFETILMKDDLRDCVIVIYNIYAKELDAYQINDCYKVTEYKTRKYSKVYKFPMKKCKLVINIIACCWKNREKYVSLLLNYKKYDNIAKFISTPHPCKEVCTCCCIFLEQSSQTEDENKELTENEFVSANSSITKTSTTFEQKPNLISAALAYQKKSKWKGYPEVTSNLNVKEKQGVRIVLRLLNAKGGIEFYEIGRDNIIFSKIIIKTNDSTSWLYKTQSKYDKLISFLFRDSIQREKIIKKERFLNNELSYNTECFLRIPMALPIKNVLKKSSQISDTYTSKFSKVGHVRSFMGSNSKKLKLLPIASKPDKQNVPSPSVDESMPPIIEPIALSKRKPKKPRCPQPRQLPTLDQEVSETVDCLIKDILHRFRNVLLTIGPDGKVAANLNAPLHTLSQSEIKILTQILNHAQTQVDKLGLTPGTRLNLNTPMENNSTGNTATNSTGTVETSENDATSSGKAEEHDKNAQKEIKKKKGDPSKKACLLNFSRMIHNKKKDYKTSFHSYLGDTLDAVPKITNVFSLNNAKSITSHSLEDNLAMKLEDSNINNPKTPEIGGINNFNSENGFKDSLMTIDYDASNMVHSETPEIGEISNLKVEIETEDSFIVNEYEDSNMDSAETPQVGDIVLNDELSKLKANLIMELNDSNMSSPESPETGGTAVLINETEAIKQNKRKSKTFIESSAKKPKIGIKTNAEIKHENSSSDDSENAECDPITSVPS